MQVKYSYLKEQFADQFETKYLPEFRELVASGEFTLGPWVDRFEKKFAAYLGVKHVVAVNCGTDALVLAFKSLGIGAGDEVITAANTFYATVGAIVAAGARPVFVDCDDRYVMNTDLIEKAITPKTKAIVPVHWAGTPVDIPALLKIADRKGIPVVEDACPAVGAKVGNRQVGSMGRINAFSMHPLKPLNVMGDGGMVATNDDALDTWLRLYRNHGMVDRDHIEFWGVNARLQPFQAIVASKVLDEQDWINDRRIRIARLLDQGLARLEGRIRVPRRPEGVREIYQMYMFTAEKRDELVKYLIAEGIEAKVHYPLPLHLQKAAKGLGYREGDFPVAERQAKSILTLPCHQYLEAEHAEFMIDRIRKFYGA